METQKNFDVNRYLGRWYEVAKKPFPFEKDCTYAIADYAWDQENQVMTIKNSCLDKNRKVIRESLGRARIPDMNDKSKLKVKFSGPDAWPGEGEYNVIYTDYDNYSIVGDSSRRFLWILSRKMRIPKEDVAMLLDKVKTAGYNPDEVLSRRELLY
jgi:apolipoprotein D and lipocalin family protein